MKFSDYLINEGDVVDMGKHRQQKQEREQQHQQMTQDDQIDTVIDQLDHAFSSALDQISEILGGDDIKAYEIISNHVNIFYDDEIQH